jgi:phospholipid/cholesterol/gamma-HCH transport system substrate-binding protein
MFKGNKNFIVGLFVTVSLAALIMFSLWLSGRTGGEVMVRYSMLFERDVSGLVIGGPVKFMGVNVGSVLRMELVQDGEIAVRVDIEVIESTPIDSDTYASLAFQGITGMAVINLAHVHGEHKPLERQPGFDHPLIKVRDVGFAALMQEIPKISTKLSALLDRATELMGDEAIGSIHGTLSNIEDLTRSLSDQKETIAALPQDLRDTVSDIRATIDTLHSTIEDLQPGIKASVDNVSKATDKLAAMTARIDKLLADNEDDMQRFVDEGLGQAPALISDTRSLLRELQKLIQEIQDDPSQLIFRPEDHALEIDP